MATFVLVHGSFHGGWCWQRVARLLRQAGHEVYTPTQTGLGEQLHLATPQTGGDGWRVPPMSPIALGITNPADAVWVQSRLTPMPLLTHQQRVHLSSSDARELPRTYILCTQFGFHATAHEAQSLGWDYFRLDKGHDAMITMPEELAQTLNKAVANR